MRSAKHHCGWCHGASRAHCTGSQPRGLRLRLTAYSSYFPARSMLRGSRRAPQIKKADWFTFWRVRFTSQLSNTALGLSSCEPALPAGGCPRTVEVASPRFARSIAAQAFFGRRLLTRRRGGGAAFERT